MNLADIFFFVLYINLVILGLGFINLNNQDNHQNYCIFKSIIVIMFLICDVYNVNCNKIIGIIIVSNPYSMQRYSPVNLRGINYFGVKKTINLSSHRKADKKTDRQIGSPRQ